MNTGKGPVCSHCFMVICVMCVPIATSANRTHRGFALTDGHLNTFFFLNVFDNYFDDEMVFISLLIFVICHCIPDL